MPSQLQVLMEVRIRRLRCLLWRARVFVELPAELVQFNTAVVASHS